MNWFCFFIAMIIISGSATALEKLTYYVNDEAGVISPEYEQNIASVLEQLRENSSVEMAVATVKTTAGIPIEEYSLKLAHDVLGDDKKDNGILLFLAVDDREYRIEVGYGLEPVISASLAGRIGREYMEPYFKEGNYAEGLYMGVYALKGVIDNDGSWETEAGSINVLPQTQAIIIIAIIILLIGFTSYMAFRQEKQSIDEDFTAAAFAAWMFSGKGRGGFGGGGLSGGGFGGFGGGGFGGGGFSGKF